jgi:dienelactone hydrolase
MKDRPNMLGAYGLWAKHAIPSDVFSLSFLHPQWSDLQHWKDTARSKVLQLLAQPKIEAAPNVRIVRTYQFDGLDIEELAWKLPYGPETEAIFIKPANSRTPLPGILGLHDHGGIKYFGKQKITRTRSDIHPFIHSHQQEYYGGVAWANELAKRGYGVLVHDVFPFESRKILPSELPSHVVQRMMAAPELVKELTPEDISSEAVITDYDVPADDESVERINLYNAFAARHEDIIAKSLFSAGMTWPGVFVTEDRYALDYLCSRQDIDSNRVGCCGLSGGGLRTNYLAGLDERIQCSVTAGFMTTWSDFVFQTCFTHTWMIYIPLLPTLMDYPDILGMRAPLPSLVLATKEDPLFTLDEVENAGRKLESIYKKAGARENFKLSLYDGPHKFDLPMQQDAFDWFDRWLVDM